jgi:hypothetical protein
LLRQSVYNSSGSNAHDLRQAITVSPAILASPDARTR